MNLVMWRELCGGFGAPPGYEPSDDEIAVFGYTAWAPRRLPLHLDADEWDELDLR